MASRPDLTDALSQLSSAFSGTLVGPDHAAYDEARRVHNGMVDKRPELIARCATPGDVVHAVAFGREHGLEIAVRGGGHNVAGRAVVDGGLMIDLSPMKGIEVDPEARTARAGGGVIWREFNEATHRHGLACTGGAVSSTGIAGLTLGGGFGWILGRYGLSIDNLLSAEVVTADGRVLRASEEENPDLFWAIRGGGGNFGVVTRFEFRLHPLTEITGGILGYPVEQAADMLRYYRELTASVPDELCVAAALTHAPDGSGMPLAGLAFCHCGPLEDGRAAVERIKAEFGEPAVDATGPMPYPEVNKMLDAGFPPGTLNYWKASFMEELSDEAIQAMVESFSRCPSPMSDLLLEHWFGAAARVPVDATAFPHRRDCYNLGIFGQWTDAADTDRCTSWVRKTYAAVAPALAEGRYVNYLGDDEEGDPVAAAYGPNYARLRMIKAEYDPENVFHLNQNIPPLEEGAPA